MKIVGVILTFCLIGIALLFFATGEDEGKITTTNNDIPHNLMPKKPLREAEVDVRSEDIPTSETIRDEYKNPALRKELSDKVIEQLDTNVDLLEKKWDERLENLFLKKLKLTQQDFEDYSVMRDGFEEDRLEAFESFHKEMVAKHGNSYRYSPSQEMKDYEGKIKTDYQQLFKKRFGEETYSQYINTLESFNDEARRNSDPKLGVLFIEF